MEKQKQKRIQQELFMLRSGLLGGLLGKKVILSELIKEGWLLKESCEEHLKEIKASNTKVVCNDNQGKLSKAFQTYHAGR